MGVRADRPGDQAGGWKGGEFVILVNESPSHTPHQRYEGISVYAHGSGISIIILVSIRRRITH